MLRGLVVAIFLVATRAHAQAAACTAPLADSIITATVPGRPFVALPSADGCHLFVSLNPAGPGEQPGVAVLDVGRTLALRRIVPTPQIPSGMALSRDGQVLIAAHNESASLFDVAALVNGGEALLGRLPDKAGAGRVYANTSPDDALLFLADERTQSITVVDFAKARAPGGAAGSVLGFIPTGDLPIALTFSPDGKWLYTTSQRVPNTQQWPVVCRKQGSLDPADPPEQVEGAVLVVDVAKARTDAAHSVARIIRAGCNPVRFVFSPKGDRAYVSARGENALLVFDARKLGVRGDTANPLVARIPVGTAPVGIAVTPDSRRVLVTNSNRFAGGADDHQSVTVIDATRVTDGAKAVLGEIPAGAFPRELRLMPNGRTLVLTNFNSKTVQLVDLAKIPGAR
ncbi:MAG: beta-propeller fold lactonase family protein [Gemmatimonadaceae bacterium]|nr:beta-propeller fold lactonase family protein [Gemmatimonadaceae bacterium]